jgi:pimeloyl-ACP methyl ester carboxylesterase
VELGEADPAFQSRLSLRRLQRARLSIRLAVVPATGHLVNLEEPDLLHRLTEDFFALVESKKWRPRGK